MRKCRRYFQLSESIQGAMNGSNNAFASNGFGGTQAGMRSSGTGALVTGSNKFHQPGVTFPLIGPKTLKQLNDYLPVLDMKLNKSIIKECDLLVPPGSAKANFHNSAPWMKMKLNW